METAESTRDWTLSVSLTDPTHAELSWRVGRPGELQFLVSGDVSVWSLVYFKPPVWMLLFDRRPDLVTLDLSGVTFLDSRAVTWLIELRQHVTSWDALVVVANPSPRVTEVLALAGLDGQFN